MRFREYGKMPATLRKTLVTKQITDRNSYANRSFRAFCGSFEVYKKYVFFLHELFLTWVGKGSAHVVDPHMGKARREEDWKKNT